MKHERNIKAASTVQLNLLNLLPSVKRQTVPPEIRFQRMLKRKPNGCVEFTGAIDHRNGGYGKFRVDNTDNGVWLAHRYAYFLLHGEVPDLIRHRCHNTKCCVHLIPGTNADNSKDMVEAGRSGKRLKREQVELVAKLWKDRDFTIKALSDQFGVNQGAIEALVTGRTWSKVTGIKYYPKKPHQRKLREAA